MTIGIATIIAAIISLIGVGVSAAVNSNTNKNSQAKQQEYNRENMETQFGYNEQAANNADERQRAQYWDLYSPAAKVQQYKDAGLSVGLMYGGGGAGGSGGSATGANGGGVGLASIGMPQLNMQNPLADFASNFTSMMSGKKTEAETSLIAEQATNEKEKRAGIITETRLKAAQAKLTESQAGLAEATTEAALKKANAEADMAVEMVIDIRTFRALNIEQQETAIEQMKAEIINKNTETLLKQSEVKINEAQARNIAETLLNIRAERALINTQKGKTDAENKEIYRKHERELLRIEQEYGFKREQLNAQIEMNESKENTERWAIVGNILTLGLSNAFRKR